MAYEMSNENHCVIHVYVRTVTWCIKAKQCHIPKSNNLHCKGSLNAMYSTRLAY